MEEASHRTGRRRLTKRALSISQAKIPLKKEVVNVVLLPVPLGTTPNIQSNKNNLSHRSVGISSQYLIGAEIKASRISELQTRGIGKSSFLMRTFLAIEEWLNKERSAMDATNHKTTLRVKSNFLVSNSLPLRQ